MPFDYSLDFKNIDFRQHPELYRVGKGEQGVLLVEPYKSEILPYWRFKTPEIARESSEKIYEMFLGYLKQDDFIGADMAQSLSKWVILALAVMLIIKQAENINKIRKLQVRKKRFFLTKKTLLKPSQQQFLKPSGYKQRQMRNIKSF